MSPRTPDSEVLTPQHGNRHVKITLSRTKIPRKQFIKHVIKQQGISVHTV